MHFFLDSTLFQNGKDVFLNNRLSREFLNICKQQNFPIYLSSVVIDEIRRQYHEFISSQIKNVKSAVGAFNTIPGIRSKDVVVPEIGEAMQAFERYFKSLHEEEIVYIVPYSNEFLPELIHRSIHRIKPFTEAKQEFRDAVIWFSYAKLAEEQQLDNCFLISNNTSDYLNKGGQIHEDLAERSNRFTLFKDAYSILNAPFMEPFKATHTLLASLKQKEWNLETILNFLKQDNIKSYVLKHLTDDLEGAYAEELWEETYHSQGVISIISVSDPIKPSIRGIDFINNYFILSGSFQLEVHFVSSRKTEDPSLMRGLEPRKVELLIYFDAAYEPDSDTLNNLAISSYENASEYWQGVHRVAQDMY